MKRKKDKADKKNSVKKLSERAGLAIKHEFYLEASWILSEMFEKKLKKLLIKFENQDPGYGFTLEQTIKRIKYLLVHAKHPELTASLEVDLIDDIRKWKNQRNEILKDIPDVHVSQVRLERLAGDGAKLYRRLNEAIKSIKSTDRSSDRDTASSG